MHRLANSVALIAVFICIVAFGRAEAIEHGNLGTISPTAKVIERDFPPIVGPYPGSALPVQAFAVYRPQVCRALVYCDTFQVDVDYPASYVRDVFFGVSVTLTWLNPKTGNNPVGNDLDLFVWPDDTGTGGPSSSQCSTPEDDPCDNLESETIAVTEPPNTGPEEVPPLFFTVVNHTGVNTGYKIIVQWYTFELPPPPRFVAPERIATSQTAPKVTGPFDFAVTEGTSGIDQPAATPRAILVPGPDGELRQIDLPFYAAGQRVVAAKDGGISTWIPAAVAGVLVAVGFSWLLVIRSRRRDEEEI